MAAARGRARGERGVILVQVAIALLMLMGFTVFVCDYGVVLVSRGQAQNAADAGALAGAVAFAYNEFGDAASLSGPASVAALGFAEENYVWGQPGVAVATVPPCPSNANVPASSDCLRVDVYRNGEAGSTTLPVFFAPILNITTQGVRATATAEVAAANAARCLKPWAVADGWVESNPGSPSTYNPADGDVYVPPYGPGGTGFKYKQANSPMDYGRQVVLKHSDMTPPLPPGSPVPAGYVVPLDLPNDTSGYVNNVVGCTGATVAIAAGPSSSCSSSNPAAGCIEVTAPTGHVSAVASLAGTLQGESNAAWYTRTDPPRGAISGSAAAASRRIVPIAVFDPSQFVTNPNVVKVVNIAGFFIEGLCGDGFAKEAYVDCSNPQDVVGRLVRFPGMITPGAGTVDPSSTFGVVIRLVR